MTSRINTEHRLTSKGGDKLQRDLKGIGDTGERAGRQLERASRGASKAAIGLDRAVGAVQGKLRTTAQTIAVLDGPLGGIASRFSSTASVIGGVGLVAGTTALAIGTLTAGLVQAVRVAEQAEQSQLRLQGVLRATGGSAGRTAAQIDALARDLGRATLTSANEARDAASVLLTFRNVQEENFDRTLRVAQDVAAVFGQSLRSSVTQLGKALEDPIQGLTALRRVGISFSQSQRDVIRSLVETGDVAEAQRTILEALEKQVGGAGEAEGQGLIGALDTLGERFNEFLEQIADYTGAAEQAAAATKGLTGIFEGASKGLAEGGLAGEIVRVNGELIELQDTLANLNTQGFGATPQADAYRAQIAQIEARLEGLITEAREAADKEFAELDQARENALSARFETGQEAELARFESVQKVIDALYRERDAITQTSAQKKAATLLAGQAKQATEQEAAAIRSLIEENERLRVAEERRKKLAQFAEDAARNTTPARSFDPFTTLATVEDRLALAQGLEKENSRREKRFAELQARLANDNRRQDIRDQYPKEEADLRIKAFEREIELRQIGLDLSDEEVQKYLEQSAALDERIQAEEKRQRTVQASTEAISDGLVAIAIEGEKASNIIKALVADLARVALRQSINSGVNAVIGSFFGSETTANANGNIIPFARGGIVDRPTVFPMARGMGLMGEAGPEAVMPLRRGADGRLGVESTGSSINVQVINQGPPLEVVEQRQRRGDDGQLSVQLVTRLVDSRIDQKLGRAGQRSPVAKRFGLRPALKSA